MPTLHLKIEGKKHNIADKSKTMIIKKLSHYGFKDCTIMRMGMEEFYIFIKVGPHIHRVGTAIMNRQGIYTAKWLDKKLLDKLKQ